LRADGAAAKQTALLGSVSAGGAAETRNANAEKDATIAKLRAQLAGSTPAEGKGGEKGKGCGAQPPKRAPIPFVSAVRFLALAPGRDGTGRDAQIGAAPNLRQRLRDGYAGTSARRHVHAWGLAASALGLLHPRLRRGPPQRGRAHAAAAATPSHSGADKPAGQQAAAKAKPTGAADGSAADAHKAKGGATSPKAAEVLLRVPVG
jgi:hypothetical protein